MAADEEKDKDDGPKMKTVKQKTEEWEQLNTQNAIWLRDPSDVTPEEYEKFYQAISKVCCLSVASRAVPEKHLAMNFRLGSTDPPFLVSHAQQCAM